MIRYIRAFFIALKMTLRGETVETRTYPRLQDWINQTLQTVNAAFKIAETNQFTSTKRASLIVRVEGREMSMETILSAVRYHLKQEYPHLLRLPDQHSITAIYATNMNDQYHIDRLLDVVEDDAVKRVLQQLKDQLAVIPPSNEI